LNGAFGFTRFAAGKLRRHLGEWQLASASLEKVSSLFLSRKGDVAAGGSLYNWGGPSYSCLAGRAEGDVSLGQKAKVGAVRKKMGVDGQGRYRKVMKRGVLVGGTGRFEGGWPWKNYIAAK